MYNQFLIFSSSSRSSSFLKFPIYFVVLAVFMLCCACRAQTQGTVHRRDRISIYNLPTVLYSYTYICVYVCIYTYIYNIVREKDGEEEGRRKGGGREEEGRRKGE